MKRWKPLLVVVMATVLLCVLSACAANSQTIGNAMYSSSSSSSADALANVEVTQTTEYLEYSNKDVDPLTLVKCDDKDVKITTQDKIDLSKVGSQDVTFDLAKDSSKATRTISFTIRDTKKPTIALIDAAPSLTQGDSFDVVANIELVADPVDGALEQVEAEPAQLVDSSSSDGSSSAAATSGESASSQSSSASSGTSASAASSASSASASSQSSSGASGTSSDAKSKSSASNSSAVPGTKRVYEVGWFTVDGTVDTETPGSYSIIVTASDLHGNRATKEFVVTVNPVPVEEEPVVEAVPAAAEPATNHYVLNTNSKKFHWPDCSSVSKMKDKNRQDVDATREEVISWGYAPCKNCNP